MRRANFALVFVLPGLLGIVLTVSMLPSYSQTVNSPRPLNVRPDQNEPRRLNPLRAEAGPDNAVQQVSGTSSAQPNPAASAAQRGIPSHATRPPQRPPQRTENRPPEPAKEDFLFDVGDDFSAPTPATFDLGVFENFDEDHETNFAFDSDTPDQTGFDPLEDFDAPVSMPNAPGTPARWAARDTITPQNAPPMAQIDPSTTVRLPISSPNQLTPPSPNVRGGSNPQVTMSQTNPQTMNQGRQTPPPSSTMRNMVTQEFVEGTGLPGPSNLEGNQMPQLALEKLAPPEVQVNQPAVLKTVVKNLGQTTAREIILRDQIPRGTRLVSTNPRISGEEGNSLYWSLGSLAPQEEIAVEMTVIPLGEGEFGSVATLQFVSEASGRVVATRAMLELEISGHSEVLLGEKITFNLALANPGTGTATGVVLEVHVPDGLEHERGRGLEFSVGDIKPKETKQYPLTLAAKAAGEIVLEIRARADNHLEAGAESLVEVLAPDLLLDIAGPRQRFLNHKVAYILTVVNPGTASAHDIDFVAKLPPGMKFENTDQQGIYDDKTHTVHWTLPELPPKESGEIELTLIPVREGEQTIRFEGVGQNHLKADASFNVSVQGIPSLSFGVACLSNPVEVGNTAVYEVKVLNRGTKAASNVSIQVRLSEGMQFASAEGPTGHRTNAGMIQFDSLAVLEPRQEKIFRFTAKCLEVGDHRISVSMSSDDMRTPVTKEESTLVYGDQ